MKKLKLPDKPLPKEYKNKLGNYINKVANVMGDRAKTTQVQSAENLDQWIKAAEANPVTATNDPQYLLEQVEKGKKLTPEQYKSIQGFTQKDKSGFWEVPLGMLSAPQQALFNVVSQKGDFKDFMSNKRNELQLLPDVLNIKRPEGSISGKAYDITNFIGEALTDPTNLVGAGVATKGKALTSIGKATTKTGSKILKATGKGIDTALASSSDRYAAFKNLKNKFGQYPEVQNLSAKDALNKAKLSNVVDSVIDKETRAFRGVVAPDEQLAQQYLTNPNLNPKFNAAFYGEGVYTTSRPSLASSYASTKNPEMLSTLGELKYTNPKLQQAKTLSQKLESVKGIDIADPQMFTLPTKSGKKFSGTIKQITSKARKQEDKTLMDALYNELQTKGVDYIQAGEGRTIRNYLNPLELKSRFQVKPTGNILKEDREILKELSGKSFEYAQPQSKTGLQYIGQEALPLIKQAGRKSLLPASVIAGTGVAGYGVSRLLPQKKK